MDFLFLEKFASVNFHPPKLEETCLKRILKGVFIDPTPNVPLML